MGKPDISVHCIPDPTIQPAMEKLRRGRRRSAPFVHKFILVISIRFVRLQVNQLAAPLTGVHDYSNSIDFILASHLTVPTGAGSLL